MSADTQIPKKRVRKGWRDGVKPISPQGALQLEATATSSNGVASDGVGGAAVDRDATGEAP